MLHRRDAMIRLVVTQHGACVRLAVSLLLIKHEGLKVHHAKLSHCLFVLRRICRILSVLGLDVRENLFEISTNHNAGAIAIDIRDTIAKSV